MVDQLQDIKEATALFGDIELASARNTVNLINASGIYTIGSNNHNKVSVEYLIYFFY